MLVVSVEYSSDWYAEAGYWSIVCAQSGLGASLADPVHSGANIRETCIYTVPGSRAKPNVVVFSMLSLL